MLEKFKFISIILLLLNCSNLLIAENNNFFEEGKKKYNLKEYEDSKFLFQRSIVFNPKDASSYLFLAKIYIFEENNIEVEKNTRFSEEKKKKK